MANPKSPYADQRQNLRLTVIWFLIGAVILGIGAAFLSSSMALKADTMPITLFLLGTVVIFAGLGFPIGVKALLNSLEDHNDFKSEVVKSKIILTGALYEIAAIAGAVAWLLTNAWWVYAIGVVALGCIVFFVLVPSVNKLYDFLELQLQRKEDGGTVAVAKKVTYEL
jgi:membrane protein YdbS with pleckstrin-like domain